MAMIWLNGSVHEFSGSSVIWRVTHIDCDACSCKSNKEQERGNKKPLLSGLFEIIEGCLKVKQRHAVNDNHGLYEQVLQSKALQLCNLLHSLLSR